MTPARRRVLLAVDGGYSKTDVVLVAAHGEVLGAARGAPFEYHPHNIAPCVAALGDTIATAAAQAGLNGAGPVADVGVYCLAGADFPQDYSQLRRAVTDAGWAGMGVVENDTFAILRAGTDRGWGVGLGCGTGLNCIGVAPNGRTVRFPAQGWYAGDWGGGFSVGQEALFSAVRGRDGRGERTALERLVPAAFGFVRPYSLVRAIYAGEVSPTAVRDLSPAVFQAADDGDAVAARIVRRLADEVVVTVRATLRRLRLTRSDAHIVLGGGILRSRSERLLGPVREGIAAAAPRADVRVLFDPPVLGAVLHGLESLDAARGAVHRVRAELTHERLTAGGG